MQTIFSIPLLAVVGPTGSGKSSTAIRLAQRFNAELISVDSLQVYRYLDIGTGKVTAEEQDAAKHHLIDCVLPDQHYDAAYFQRDADQLIEDIHKRGKRIILVGGTGLYLKALLRGLFDTPSDLEVRKKLEQEASELGLDVLHERLTQVDPQAAQRIHPNDQIRIVRALEVYDITGTSFTDLSAQHQQQKDRYPAMLVGIEPPRPILNERIHRRIDEMLKEGWSTELEMLRNKGYGPELKPLSCIGYRELNAMFDGIEEPEEALRLLRRNTRNYAKRQMTWFRKEPIRWYTSAEELLEDQQLLHEIEQFFQDSTLPNSWPEKVQTEENTAQ